MQQDASHRRHLSTIGKGNSFLANLLNFVPCLYSMEVEKKLINKKTTIPVLLIIRALSQSFSAVIFSKSYYFSKF